MTPIQSTVSSVRPVFTVGFDMDACRKMSRSCNSMGDSGIYYLLEANEHGISKYLIAHKTVEDIKLTIYSFARLS